VVVVDWRRSRRGGDPLAGCSAGCCIFYFFLFFVVRASEAHIKGAVVFC
jgi:hypothetical protein